MQTYLGDGKIMKKIITTAVLCTLLGCAFVSASCPINSPGVCKADIGSGINTKLQDKILPNNLEQVTQPNNSFNNRSNLGQPHVPDNINMEPMQQENTKPYDANCQFGNCINRSDAGANKN